METVSLIIGIARAMFIGSGLVLVLLPFAGSMAGLFAVVRWVMAGSAS